MINVIGWAVISCAVYDVQVAAADATLHACAAAAAVVIVIAAAAVVVMVHCFTIHTPATLTTLSTVIVAIIIAVTIAVTVAVAAAIIVIGVIT